MGRKRNLAALTGLRFIAAMAVYFFHFGAGFSERVGAPEFITRILKNGYVGVSIFFVLSGFILYYTYSNQVASLESYVDYMVARIARIYPVYVLALLIALPLTSRPVDLNSSLRVLSMTQAWTGPESALGFSWLTQAWTLSVELAFYLMFPFYAHVIARMRTSACLTVATSLAALIAFWGLPTITPSTVPGSIPEILMHFSIPLLRTAEFVFGMCLCKLVNLRSAEPSQDWRSNLTVTAVLMASVTLLALYESRSAVAAATVGFGALIALLASSRSWLSELLSHRAAVFAGGASYSLYLLQAPVHDFVEWVNPGRAAPIIQLILCLGLSSAVFKYFEEPARKVVKSKLDRHVQVSTLEGTKNR